MPLTRGARHEPHKEAQSHQRPILRPPDRDVGGTGLQCFVPFGPYGHIAHRNRTRSHGGNDNGRLPVTTEDFVEHRMHRTSVSPALRESEALGFIRITERGRGGNAEHRMPNKFFLTFAQAATAASIAADARLATNQDNARSRANRKEGPSG